jgi:Uma2 family endonuclease
MARALRAPPVMTVEEFLDWEDGTDARYELEHGVPVAMAPPWPVHATIAQNVSEIISAHMADKPPCRPMQGAGVVVSRDDGKVYVPDILLTCEPPSPDARTAIPLLVVEVLSPSTRGLDKGSKVAAYGGLPSVQEIWLVESTSRNVLVWRRTGATWIAAFPYTGSESFESAALGGTVSLDRVYHLTGIEA